MTDSNSPETRASLLMRVRDPEDHAAWLEFVEIYRPAVYRLARRKGLQHADAEDLVQSVMLSISRAIDQFEPDPQRGRFRTWLYRIAHNAILNCLTRDARHRGSGDSAQLAALAETPAPSGPDSEYLRLELQREVFHWAARQIRGEFQSATWEAFWLTAVEEMSIEAAAKQLDKSRGAVYAARSRVMSRLNQKVREFEA